MLNRVVRHDIQNDMNVVQGHAQLIEAELEPDQRELVEPVLHNTAHAIELTETVRDLIDAATGEDDLVLDPVDLGQLLRQEVEKARTTHDQGSFELLIPDDEEQLTVLATPMLSSVFNNLLGNAVRHNDREHPHVRVSVSTGPETITVRVADDGPGVPEEQREEIFGKGEMGLESSGSGIGLYLVDTLVDQYGGTVSVEDNDPRGAVFVVELERADADPSSSD
jgi:signal transduction histidine kinase